MAKKFYEAINNLEQLFDQFNDHLFNGELERPIITIQADTTSGAYGWCTTQKIWKSEKIDEETGEILGKEEYYEINICAEHLNRPIKEICGTLIHEMVHLDNLYKGIKDTSANGRYHNKKFKETAEAHGLIIEKDMRYGWTITKLHEDTEKWIDENVKIQGFGIARAKKLKKSAAGKKSKYNYYMCPCCENKFYSIYEINAICKDCGSAFEQYK